LVNKIGVVIFSGERNGWRRSRRNRVSQKVKGTGTAKPREVVEWLKLSLPE
jgi:hypothetical protein